MARRRSVRRTHKVHHKKHSAKHHKKHSVKHHKKARRTRRGKRY